MKLVLALFFVLSFAAHGEDLCSGDIARLCKDVKTGAGRIVQCLRDHHDELSEGCKSSRERNTSKSQDFRTACSDEIVKFCSDLASRKLRTNECLKAHSEDLSAICRDWINH